MTSYSWPIDLTSLIIFSSSSVALVRVSSCDDDAETMTELYLPTNRKSFYQLDFGERTFQLPARRFYQEPCYQSLADEGAFEKHKELVKRIKTSTEERESNCQVEEKKTEDEPEENDTEVKNTAEESDQVTTSAFNDWTQISRDVIEELVRAATYTTTYAATYSKDTLGELEPTVPTPPSKVLKHADPVRYRARIYENDPGKWQSVYCDWDKQQSRRGYNAPADTANGVANRWAQESHRLTYRLHPNQMKQKSRSCLRKGVVPGDANKKLRFQDEQVTYNKLPDFTVTHQRPPPGYGGFVPRLPTINKTNNMAGKQQLLSTSRRAYRAFSSYHGDAKEFAHQGPLSKTVTLTHPFNPFNKVDQQPLTLEPLVKVTEKQSAKSK